MTPAPVKLPVSVAVPAVRVPSMMLAPALVKLPLLLTVKWLPAPTVRLPELLNAPVLVRAAPSFKVRLPPAVLAVSPASAAVVPPSRICAGAIEQQIGGVGRDVGANELEHAVAARGLPGAAGECAAREIGETVHGNRAAAVRRDGPLIINRSAGASLLPPRKPVPPCTVMPAAIVSVSPGLT